MESDYIIPTAKNLIFTACNTYNGYIEKSFYKQWCVNSHVGSTFATSYADAVNNLHEWIKENGWLIDEHPKCMFYIEVLDGSYNQRIDEVVRTRVYEITAKKAKKYILCE